jgi:pyruvate dehydrogenase E2 component (dihydrolipoamide acetyltransferase)
VNGRATVAAAPPDAATPPGATPAGANGRRRASPLARRLALAHGVDLAAIPGSGPGGRITRDDVTAFVASRPAPLPAAPPAAPAGLPAGVPAAPSAPLPPSSPRPAGAPVATAHEPLSRIRQTIARRLTDSWTAAPHIFVTMAIRMDKALALRQQANTALEAAGAGKVSVNDLIVKACGTALRRHPRINVSYDNGTRVVHGRVNVGVAVALEDGLVTVTVPDADAISLSTIAAKAGRAREGKLLPEDVAVPSTFTISNLGMYGVEHFTAIINPPEAAILAVGAAVPTPVVEDGAVVVQSVMHVTLSADHRVIDGAAAAAFLVTLRDLLENPLAMLV